ncbi:hypothetical protein OE88DRAFT_1655298 [Heliocybe sulcata]|uniref:Zn(2)-C6 fungal-type domain-containing protein n=1 Tax=Heliocybe sulcata TaxID=5364 RepID=A0A5C3NC45_9AGAM|nr:hypothetical protein OE88DRAFT_1655298 [Heliocybe sulcata]
MSTSPTPADKRASAESPSAGAKPASTTAKKVCEKKPVLACLFCRGRKIACGPPLPGSKDKTCK